MQKLFTAAQTTFLVSVVINFEDGAKPAGFLAVNKTDNATRHSEIPVSYTHLRAHET